MYTKQKIYIRQRAKQIFLFAITIFFTSAHAANSAATKQPAKLQSLDGIVAVVNKGIITQSQLDHQVKLVKKRISQRNLTPPPAKTLQRQVLQHLINVKLQVQFAKEHGASVNDSMLNETINGIAAQNHLTATQLRHKIAKNGVSFKQYRQQISDEILMNEARQHEVASKIKISDAEVARALKSIQAHQRSNPVYHLQAILIALPEAPTPAQVDQAQQKAKQIVTELHQGADFSSLAIANSAGRNALSGGDMGWRRLAALPPVLAGLISGAKTGSIVGPLQTSNGFYIVKIIGKRGLTKSHYVTETKLRHILIRTTKFVSSNEAKRHSQRIYHLLKAGQSFTQLAQEYSQDARTASKGGELGWVKPSQVAPSVAYAMHKLKKGAVSHPIQTPAGWNIIQVQGHRRVNNSQQFLHAQVKKMIYERKYQQGVQSWIQALRGDAYIKVY